MSGTFPPEAFRPRTTKRLSLAELRAKWQEIMKENAEASWLWRGESPGKFDLNIDGSLQWNPSNHRVCGFQRAFIAGELKRLLPAGVTFTLCPVETELGIRMVDVAWASPEFAARHGVATPLARAPELCVEAVFDLHTVADYGERVANFLRAGAEEVWLVNETGKIEIVGREGARKRSALGIHLAIVMGPRTPGLEAQHTRLGALSSRYVDVDKLAWKPTGFPGVEIKVLMEDPETGLLTTLTRMAPGAELPLHEHAELEQSWVLEGRLVDHEGEVTAGNYVWRPKGSRHVARAPEGCFVLGFFLRPNRFL